VSGGCRESSNTLGGKKFIQRGGKMEGKKFKFQDKCSNSDKQRQMRRVIENNS